jgi:hypothetical protein
MKQETRFKAITPNLVTTKNFEVLIEKVIDGPNAIVLFHHPSLEEPRARLFATERDADDFIEYLTENDF